MNSTCVIYSKLSTREEANGWVNWWQYDISPAGSIQRLHFTVQSQDRTISHNLLLFELSFSFRFTCHLTVLLFDHALSRAHHWYTTQKLSGWKINYFCFFSRFPSFAVASNIFWAQSLAVESTYSILRRLILKAFLFKRYLFSGFSECFAHRHTQGRVYTDTIWK